jgi:hypothetical protein
MEWHCPVCGRLARYYGHERCFAKITDKRAVLRSKGGER